MNISALKIALRRPCTAYTGVWAPCRQRTCVPILSSPPGGIGQFNLPPCASTSSSIKRDNHSTYLGGLLGRANELMSGKCSETINDTYFLLLCTRGWPMRSTALPEPRPRAEGQSVLQSPEGPPGAHLASGAPQPTHGPAASCRLGAAAASRPPPPQPRAWDSGVLGAPAGPGRPQTRRGGRAGAARGAEQARAPLGAARASAAARAFPAGPPPRPLCAQTWA